MCAGADSRLNYFRRRETRARARVVARQAGNVRVSFADLCGRCTIFPATSFGDAYELRRFLMTCRREPRRVTEIDTSTISIADAPGDAARCSAAAEPRYASEIDSRFIYLVPARARVSSWRERDDSAAIFAAWPCVASIDLVALVAVIYIHPITIIDGLRLFARDRCRVPRQSLARIQLVSSSRAKKT